MPIAAIALVAALIGGAVVLGGQQLLNRTGTLGIVGPGPGPGSTARPDGSIAKIAADALPSVVTIRIKTTDGSGTGSGFIIDNQGHILTNNHVATAGGGSGHDHRGAEQRQGAAGDHWLDASTTWPCLKIDATDIPPLQFGASQDVVCG